MEILPLEVVEKVQAAAQPEALLRRIDYRPEMIQNVGATIKAFCPIHQEANFRTLLIDVPSWTYRCSNKHCAGHGGGDMIDLYARSKHLSYHQALVEVAHLFDVDVDLALAEESLARAMEVAEHYLDLKAFGDAEIQLDRILSVQPHLIDALEARVRLYAETGATGREADARLQLGRTLADRGETAAAAEQLEKYLNVQPGDPQARRLYIRCLEELGQEDRLIGEYVNLADELTAQGDVDGALQVYRRIEMIGTDAIDVSLHVFQLLVSAGRIGEAIGEKKLRCDQLIEQGEYGEALECLEEALKLDLERDDLRVAMAELTGAKQLGADALDRCLQEIREMLAAGTDERARTAGQALDALEKGYDEDVRLIELRAELYDRAGNKSMAQELRLEATDLYEERGEFEQALLVLQKAGDNRRDDVSIISREADLLQKMGRTQQAIWCYLVVATIFENAGEFEHAASIYETIIGLAPDDMGYRTHQFELYVKLGVEPMLAAKALELSALYAAHGEPDHGAEVLSRALDVAPEHEELIERHAELLFGMSQIGEATRQFHRLAELRAGRGQFPAAQKVLERALECTPGDLASLELRADVLAQQDLTLPAMSEYGALVEKCIAAGDNEGAVRVARKVLSLQPDHLPTLERMADAYDRMGDTRQWRLTQLKRVALYRESESFSRAADLCRAMIERDALDLDAHEQLVEIAEETGQAKEAVASLWGLARAHADRGETDLEQARLEEVLRRSPRHREATLRRMELAVAAGSPQTLREAIERLRERFEGEGNRAEAIDILERLAADSGASPELLQGLVRLYREGGDRRAEETALERLIERLTETGREAEAESALGELAGLRPNDLKLRRRRIELLLKKGKRSEAALQWQELARIYRDRNQPVQAEEALREVLELEPENEAAHEALIGLHIERQEADAAREAIERLASMHLKAGDPDKAIEVYEWEAELGSVSESTLRKIIAIRRREGDTAGAVSAYRRLLDTFDAASHSDAYEKAIREALELAPEDKYFTFRLADHLAAEGRPGEAEQLLTSRIEDLLASKDWDGAEVTLDKLFECKEDSVRGKAFRAELLARRGKTDEALAEFLNLAKVMVNATESGPARRSDLFANGNFEGPARLEACRFDSFVVGTRNNFAHAAAKAISRNPASEYNPLFIYSDVGLGKTHLCHAIANEILERHPDKKVMFVMTQDFVANLIEAIQNNTIGELREHYRQADVLIVDDIHQISGRERAQEEFFHIFNAIYEAGKQIVITCDRPPAELAHLERRLRSRFGAGVIVDIQAPELETRIAILRRELTERGWSGEVENEVLMFLAENITDNVRDLKAALKQVLALAELGGEPVTVALAERALGQIGVRA